MNNFKNLIFDIGNVIIDIDVSVTVAEFQKLATVDFTEIISYSKQHHVFDALEKGEITPQQFRNELKRFMKPNVSDAQINAAWNSILIHYPQQKFSLLKELKTKYKTFALSNTNEIHIATFNESVKRIFSADNFESFFHRAYYSSDWGMRKPDKKFYELVLQKENLIARETFFVDDNLENVEAAKRLGIHAYQLKESDKLHELLRETEVI